MMKKIRTKIEVGQASDLEQLKKEISRGGRFIVFQYCISLFFAVTLRRLSRPIFFPKDEHDDRQRKKYNRISRWFGWWGIPWGPIYTIRSIRLNNEGGMDVTNDIMLNLDQESLSRGYVDIVHVSEVFEKPDKWDLKAFQKTLKSDFETNPKYVQIVVGLYLNTEAHHEPYYVVGLHTGIRFEEAVQEVKKSLSKQFRKHVLFDFVDLSQKDEFCDDLQRQGMHLVQAPRRKWDEKR